MKFTRKLTLPTMVLIFVLCAIVTPQNIFAQDEEWNLDEYRELVYPGSVLGDISVMTSAYKHAFQLMYTHTNFQSQTVYLKFDRISYSRIGIPSSMYASPTMISLQVGETVAVNDARLVNASIPTLQIELVDIQGYAATFKFELVKDNIQARK